jgi:hypothetical protein
MIGGLRREILDYFLCECGEANGLTRDKNKPGAPASIAACGMGLSVFVVGVERGLMERADAVARTLKLLRFLRDSAQGAEVDATGHKGFYCHFLDMESGRRAEQSEISTADTAILMAGVLTAASYFNGDGAGEKEIREVGEFLYRRVDWRWALNGGTTLSHGWTPESGFLPYRWDKGYSEALLPYVLALGSPTFAIDPAGYREWTATFEWVNAYGVEYLYAGPLFIHQMAHLWLDFRGIRDDFNRRVGIDYFENSRRATQVHRQYAIENPQKFERYGEFIWGLTASDGPGPATREVNGVKRDFFDYIARGAPYGPDDGTVSPWVVATSLPFAPEIVIPTVRHAVEVLKLRGESPYGFVASFNPTFPEKTRNLHSWMSEWVFGINEGPMLMMIENFQSGLIWRVMRGCGFVVDGLKRAGFGGGWLEG